MDHFRTMLRQETALRLIWILLVWVCLWAAVFTVCYEIAANAVGILLFHLQPTWYALQLSLTASLLATAFGSRSTARGIWMVVFALGGLAATVATFICLRILRRV